MSLKLPEKATEELFKQNEPHIVGETDTNAHNQVDLEHQQGLVLITDVD